MISSTKRCRRSVDAFQNFALILRSLLQFTASHPISTLIGCKLIRGFNAQVQRLCGSEKEAAVVSVLLRSPLTEHMSFVSFRFRKDTEKHTASVRDYPGSQKPIPSHSWSTAANDQATSTIAGGPPPWSTLKITLANLAGTQASPFVICREAGPELPIIFHGGYYRLGTSSDAAIMN